MAATPGLNAAALAWRDGQATPGQNAVLGNAVMRACRSATASRHVPLAFRDDTIGAAVVGVLSRLRRFDPARASAETFIMATAVYEVVDWMRSQTRLPRRWARAVRDGELTHREALDMAGLPWVTNLEEPIPGTDLTYGDLAWHELDPYQETLEALTAHLDAKARAIVGWRAQGLKMHEIGTITGLTTARVSQLLGQAVKDTRQRWRDL